MILVIVSTEGPFHSFLWWLTVNKTCKGTSPVRIFSSSFGHWEVIRAMPERKHFFLQDTFPNSRGGRCKLSALTTAVYPENSGWRRLVNITIRWQSNRYQGHPALVQKLDTLHCAEWTTCLVWQCMDAEWFCCSMFIQITMPCISEYTTVLYCITTQHGCRLQRILKMTKYARRGFGDRCPSSQLSLQDPSLLSTSSPATI